MRGKTRGVDEGGDGGGEPLTGDDRKIGLTMAGDKTVGVFRGSI